MYVCRDSSWKALQAFQSALVLKKSRTSVAARRTSAVFIVCFSCVSLELPYLQLTTVSGPRHQFAFLRLLLWGGGFFSTDKSIWLISFPCHSLLQALRTGHWRWWLSLGRGEAWGGKLALFSGKLGVQGTWIGKRGRSLAEESRLAGNASITLQGHLLSSLIRELLHEDLSSAIRHYSC